MPFRNKQKRVLIALGWYDYRLHRGIERFAQENSWFLTSNLAREHVLPWGWDGDGILAWLGAWDELAEFVERQNLPTVDFSFRRPHLNFPRVLEDHPAGARLVAEHLVSRGAKGFVFYSEAPNWSYDERGKGFLDALDAMGSKGDWLRWQPAGDDRGEWGRKQKWLAAELLKMARPVGVYAANDQHALDVLDACEKAGLRVPEEVAIVGSENNLLAPDAMQIPISSLDTNLELLGYKGAEVLNELMRGRKPPKKPLRVPPKGIVVRKSSDLLAVGHPGVARSLRFIWEHGTEPVSVKDLVRVAAMSRRGLHKAFVEHVGRTPGEELHRVRIEQARRLLVETDHKIQTLSSMCGYQSANSFCVAFKKTVGMSPAEFRKEMAAPRTAEEPNTFVRPSRDQ